MKEIKNDVFARARKLSQDESTQNGYAKWGIYDDYPIKILATAQDDADSDGLSQGSTWHTAAIEGVVKNIVADGLAHESGEDLSETINAFNESPNELFSKIAYDWKVLGGFAVEVIWTAEGVAGLSEPEISELYHIPMGRVRAKEKNYRGYVEGYYVSRYFGARNRPVRDPEKDDRAEYIPTFNPSAITETEDRSAQGKQLLVFQRPSRTGDYYPVPDYKGGLIDVFTDSILRKSRISVLNNAIIASSVIQMVMPPGEDAERDVINDFDNQISGAQNAGTPIILRKPEGDAHIIGAPTSISDTADTNKDFDVDIRNRILSSHQIVSSRVLGIKEDNSGFEQQQIEQEFNVFLTFTIKPNQSKILSGLNRLAPYLSASGSNFIINPIAFSIQEVSQDDITDQETEDDITPSTDGTDS